MKQVAQRLSGGRDLRSLMVALTPILEEHGWTINQLIAATSAYTVTNGSTDRSYDANATTLDEIADVLGTLIADLQAKGILS